MKFSIFSLFEKLIVWDWEEFYSIDGDDDCSEIYDGDSGCVFDAMLFHVLSSVYFILVFHWTNEALLCVASNSIQFNRCGNRKSQLLLPLY